MTIIDWRKNPERLSMALEVITNPILHEMMAIMDASGPAREQQAVADGFGATRILGRIEGYQSYADMLRSFAEPLPSAPDEVMTTWGVDLPDPNQK